MNFLFFLPQDENSASTKDKDKESSGEAVGGQASKTLEERRRSMLDHHWAVPSKDRCSLSVDDEQQDSLNSDKVFSFIFAFTKKYLSPLNFTMFYG